MQLSLPACLLAALTGASLQHGGILPTAAARPAMLLGHDSAFVGGGAVPHRHLLDSTPPTGQQARQQARSEAGGEVTRTLEPDTSIASAPDAADNAGDHVSSGLPQGTDSEAGDKSYDIGGGGNNGRCAARCCVRPPGPSTLHAVTKHGGA